MKGITERTAKVRHVITSNMKAINSRLKSTPKSPEVKRNIRLPTRIEERKSKHLIGRNSPFHTIGSCFYILI